MPKYEKALFLYHINAGKTNIEQKLSQTLPILSRHIKELTVLQTDTAEETENVCKTFGETIDLLIILGGDGTVHTCLNSIAPLEKRPIIAILPGGTSNDFSRMLQIPQNLQAAAEAIVKGEIIEIDIGKSNDRYFLNFWGIGLVADTSQNVNENEKKSFGALSYIMTAIRTVNNTQSFSYELNSDNGIFKGEAVLIAILNGKYIGTREIPISTISPNDGKLDVLVIKDSTLASFRELLSMNRTIVDNDEMEQLTHFQASSLSISTSEIKDIDMDGEIPSSTPAKISVLPKHLKMICSTEIG
ncbi:diacylglycerol/lipid kinase family protein [Oceanobacillus damuensis]|uniref:diacylglycerol/lipid kinase family protein n=1 Tax=Oceanobacillus damuensis TaxID=937928 RepID=UPI00082971B3|nr:YegS/Rv2252/BmrU family lipid kinase [Oceanobacillus damuensis]